MRMTCWMLEGPGEVDAFQPIARDIPAPAPGWITIAVSAFGLNRSELFSRRGLSSPDFSFPRVLGLECAGTILDTGDSDLSQGQTVIALMGGMGRSYDGGYATHVSVPRSQVFPVPQTIGAATLGAIPETYNTAEMMIVRNMKLSGSEVLFVHGGTSALGMACISIAKDLGCTVIASSRSTTKADVLKNRSRTDHVVVDDADMAAAVAGLDVRVNAVAQCVGGTQAIETTCAFMPGGGIMGLGGQLGEAWDTDAEPSIPDGVRTVFTRSDLVRFPDDAARMNGILNKAADGAYVPNIFQTFGFDDLPEAHRVMENNEAVGKLVVVV